MKNKTAVEWLDEQFLDGRHHTDKEYKEIFEEAKEMEKQQIIEAWDNGIQWEWDSSIRNSEEYYNETFKKTEQ